jgi:hypothetical protein
LGTIDVANTVTPSEALLLTIENPTSIKNWNTSIHSGLLEATNNEQNLDKLTFSFDNSVSSLRPVVVRIESFNADEKRTGGLEKTVYPATANHFLRSAFELSDMKTFGEGKFNSLDSFVNFSFSISDGQTTGFENLTEQTIFFISTIVSRTFTFIFVRVFTNYEQAIWITKI